MSKNPENQNQTLHTNLRLVRSSKRMVPEVITSVLNPDAKREYSKVVSQLVILDVFAITVITYISSFHLIGYESWLYPFNILLFITLAYVFTLYRLPSNHYITGKMTLLAICFLIPQIFLLGSNQASIINILGYVLSGSTLFFMLSIIHHRLSQSFTEASGSSFYFYIENAIKRGLDIIIASLGLLLTAPFLWLISLLIWLDDRGPVLISQCRIGLNEKPFLMYKFRSMHVNSDSLLKEHKTDIPGTTPILFKMKNDPRITKLGRIIRQLSVDEIPQLWNVLIGEMSLVGPRPPLPNEYMKMNDEHRRKFQCKPGITGYWQITGRVQNERHFDAVALYDNYYVDNWSILKDIEILLQTIPVVLLQKGAY